MTFRVHVSLKPSVLDAQGQTIGSALRGHGHTLVADVRQGKYFDIRIAEGTGTAEAQAEVDQIARDVLTNPVIENYHVEALD